MYKLRSKKEVDVERLESWIPSLEGLFKDFGKVFSTIAKTYSSSETQIENASITKRTEEDIAHAYETISMVFKFLVDFHISNFVINSLKRSIKYIY